MQHALVCVLVCVFLDSDHAFVMVKIAPDLCNLRCIVVGKIVIIIIIIMIVTAN